jgi:hypothetical protein
LTLEIVKQDDFYPFLCDSIGSETDLRRTASDGNKAEKY